MVSVWDTHMGKKQLGWDLTGKSHTTSTPSNQGRSPTMARITVVTASPLFEGKDQRQWLPQLSCYYASLGLEAEEILEDGPAFLIRKARSYWCTIDPYAAELRPVDWEGFKHLMLARFRGQTVGSTRAKLQKLRYNGDFELLAQPLAEVLAEADHPLGDLTLGLFFSYLAIETVKPMLEDDFTNWVQARKRMRDTRCSELHYSPG